MKSFIYFNLRKKCFSIKHDGIVVAHASAVTVFHATTKVSEAGRQRVLKEKVKNVHAGVVGHVFGFTGTATPRGKVMGWEDNALNNVDYLEEKSGRSISYNPYKGSTFFYQDTDEAFTGSKNLYLNGRKIYEI